MPLTKQTFFKDLPLEKNMKKSVSIPKLFERKFTKETGAVQSTLSLFQGKFTKETGGVFW